jgi:cell division protein FtsB
MSLWGLGIGVILLRLSLWLGFSVIAIAGGIAVFYFVKQTSYHDKLENLESEIHKLEISMA